MPHLLHSGCKLRSTIITVRVEVSCLFRFTPGTNYGSHWPQLHDGGLILCWSRIRKFVTQREPTDTQTDTQRMQLQRPLLSLMDCRVEGANNDFYSRNGHMSEGICLAGEKFIRALFVGAILERGHVIEGPLLWGCLRGAISTRTVCGRILI